MISKPFTVEEVAALSNHGANWVRAAVNSGALESLPRQTHRHQFTEEHVSDWINKGAPQFPERMRRTA